MSVRTQQKEDLTMLCLCMSFAIILLLNRPSDATSTLSVTTLTGTTEDLTANTSTLVTTSTLGATSTPGASSSISTTSTTTTTRSRSSTTTSACVPNVRFTEWKKEDFPHPQTDVTRCGRQCRKSWICDPNGVIGDNFYLSEIETIITRIRRNGLCGCLNCNGTGYQISVALVNRMKFQSWETVSTSSRATRAREFASFLRSDAWHIQGACQDDVVIFISRVDRQVQTAVGPRATSTLTSTCIEKVYNDAKSDLQKGLFGKAVNNMLLNYEQTIRSGNCDNLVTSATTAQSSFVVAIVVSLFIFVIFIMVVVLWCVRAGRCPHGGQGGLYIGGGGHYHHHHHHGYHYNTGSSGGSGGGGGGFSSFGTGDGGGGGGGGF